jgi:uncharacterized RDD family membrane protein YckC
VFCAKCGSSLRDDAAFCASCGAPVAGVGPSVPPTFTPFPPSPTPYAQPAPPPAFGAYASWGDRAIGYIIDSLFVGAAMFILFLVLGGVFGSLAAMGGESSGVAGSMCCMMIVMFPIATLLVGLYNRVYLVSLRGYSIGQGVMKLKTIDANGQLLTQGNALIRLLAQAALGFIPFLGMLDLLWPLWDDRRQTLHDKAVGSFVIHNPDAR